MQILISVCRVLQPNSDGSCGVRKSAVVTSGAAEERWCGTDNQARMLGDMEEDLPLPPLPDNNGEKTEVLLLLLSVMSDIFTEALTDLLNKFYHYS